MVDLTPPLAVTVAPLTPSFGGDVRRAVAHIASAGFRSVQLSAAQKGLRPRELDHRARKDVLAMLGRSGLMLSGLDLFVPADHWLDSTTQDRAVGAALAAIDLAAEFGRAPLSLTMPLQLANDDISRSLLAAADSRSIVLALHAEDDLDGLRQWLQREDQPSMGAAVDPAALLAMGHDPAEAIMKVAEYLRVARLDDYSRASVASSGGRCVLGAGRLDLAEYCAALSACPSLRAIVIELRELADPIAALAAAADAWDRAAGRSRLQ